MVRRLLFVPLGPGLYFATAVFTGWPTMLGIGMNLDTPVMTILGAASIAITLVTFGAVITRLTAPSDGTPTPVPTERDTAPTTDTRRA